jgi:hypothetical protein
MRDAIHNSARLLCLTLGMWLLLVWPAYKIGGEAGVEGLSYAAALCLIPGWIAFALQSQLALLTKGSAKMQPVFAMLAATGLRLIFVLGGVLVLRDLRPSLGFSQFMVWVVVFYFATLFYETRTSLKQVSA